MEDKLQMRNRSKYLKKFTWYAYVERSYQQKDKEIVGKTIRPTSINCSWRVNNYDEPFNK
jgi:hypothetical protein